jgi:hypothetical protein
MDAGAYKLARTLLDELTAILPDTRAGDVCEAAVHAGDMIPMYGGCSSCTDGSVGFAATRVVSIYPTASFPQPVGAPGLQQVYGGHVVELQAVVDRCYPTPEDNAMPTVAELDSLARDQHDDMAALMRAVQCAFPRSQQVIPGMCTPRGPSGGVYGVSITVLVAVDLSCGCDVLPAPIDDQVPRLPGDPRG